MKRWLGIAVLPVVLLAGCSAPQIKVTGTLTVPWGGMAGSVTGMTCLTDPSGGYADIRSGAQVVVKDADGKIVGTGKLGDGKTHHGDTSLCEFGFKVSDVDGSSDAYSIEVSHRGELAYSKADLKAPLELSLG